MGTEMGRKRNKKNAGLGPEHGDPKDLIQRIYDRRRHLGKKSDSPGEKIKRDDRPDDTRRGSDKRSATDLSLIHI